MQNPLVGTWELVSSTMENSDGEVVYPLGRDCTGHLVLDSNGQCTAHIMRQGRPLFAGMDLLGGSDAEIRSAYSGYIAFWGSYQVTPERLTYEVKGSLFPNWIGSVNERRWQLKGEELTLRTTPVVLQGHEVTGVLTWRRVKSAGASKHHARKALIIYFSMSGQTQRVTEALQKELNQRGWQSQLCRLHLDDPCYRLQLPVEDFWRFMGSMIVPQASQTTARIRLEPEDPRMDPDLILIGSPTWWFRPALPITSFMTSPRARELFAGRSFGVFTVCRAAWQGNLNWVRERGERLGGLFLDHVPFTFPGSTPQSMLSFIHKWTRDQVPPSAYGLPLHEYGVAETQLSRIPRFVSRLAVGVELARGTAGPTSEGEVVQFSANLAA